MSMNLERTGATVCLSALLLLLAGCDGGPAEEPPPFPQKAGLSLQFPANKDEDRRLVGYWPDGVSIRSVQIEYKNGITSYLYFRIPGTLERIEEFYPPQEPTGARVRKSIVELSDDGVSYLRHEAYRTDGTLARQGQRLEKGGYVTYHLDESGNARRERLTFDQSRQLLEQETYFPSGAPERRLTRQSPSAYRHEIFAPDGARIADIHDKKYTGLEGHFLFGDGRIKARIDGHRLGYDIEYFDDQGKKTWWVEFIGGSVRVTAFDSSGNELYKQFWNRAAGESRSWCQGGIHHLERVDVLSRDGGRVARTRLEIKDGSVSRIIEYGDGLELISEKEYASAPRLEKVHSLPSAVITARPDFECLPVPERMNW